MTARRPSSLPPPRFGWSARTPLTGVSPTPGGSFSIRHTEAVTQRVHEARRVLDLSINYYEQFKRFGDRLASERCTEHQLRAVLDKLYPNGTSDSVSSRTRSSRQQTKDRIGQSPDKRQLGGDDDLLDAWVVEQLAGVDWCSCRWPGVQLARASAIQASMSSGMNRNGPSRPSILTDGSLMDGMRPALAAS
jgi:Domain of unknown function (DUF932)